MIICRLPSFLQPFFSPARRSLSKPRFKHLWTLVVAVVINLRSAKLVHLSALTPGSGHRTRHGAFLSHSDWDAPALVEDAALDLLRRMRPQPGEVIELVLDDTRIAKRGRCMGYLSKIWDHKQQRFVHGHIVLMACICFRGVVLPWRLELWKPKGHSGPRYRKLVAMAADLIRSFKPPVAGLKVRVLFDAFYLCPQVTHACEDQGFTFFSVASRNRCFAPDGFNAKTDRHRHRRKGRRIDQLMKGMIRHQGQSVHMRRARGRKVTLRLAKSDGQLSRIGPVRMIVSHRPRDAWKKTIAIVTDERNLSARQIVTIYEKRWMIEVLFKELRQDLGLADYQMLSEDGIVHHLHICCLAHLLLTHQSMEGLGAKAIRKAHQQVKLPPMNERLNQLRAHITREQIKHLCKGERDAPMRAKLYQLLQVA